MPLDIENAAVEALIEEIVRLTGETKTEAVRRALVERREHLVLRRGGEAPDEPRGGGRPPRVRRGRRVIVDTSALAAMVFEEPGHERVRACLFGEPC